jgi:hypothetical protein
MDTLDDIPSSLPPQAGGADAPAGRTAAPGRGAESSNTAPQKYNADAFRLLRCGIDSLYLSFRGELSLDWFARLTELKEKAQSESKKEQSLAQVKIGEHLFEVADRGSRFYAFVLRDNAFSISVSRGTAVPLAYAQVRSEYLAHQPLEAIVEALRFVVNTLGKVKGSPLVSRVDLCADFVPPCEMDGWTHRAWVTRARVIRPHYVNHRFTGWSIGEGGPLVCRLYDKVFEIVTKSQAVHLFELWGAAGWEMSTPVFRLEAQFRRDVLDQMGLKSVEQVTRNLRGLWRYFSEDWLRLTVPDDSDINPTRWPTHPLWAALSSLPWGESEQPRLKRFRKERLPRDERIFPAALGYLSSFMARERIEDSGEGLGTFWQALREHFDSKAKHDGQSFEDLLQTRVAAKRRLYNTLDNTLKDPARLAAIRAQAEAYRRAKDGDDEDA